MRHVTKIAFIQMQVILIEPTCLALPETHNTGDSLEEYPCTVVLEH